MSKIALEKMITSRAKKLDDEEFITCLALVEQILNSRPIAVINDDLQKPISPQHFLIGDVCTDLLPVPDAWKVERRFWMIQKCLDEFWETLQLEILPQMRRQQKWYTKRENLSVGQVVLILEKSTRGRWPLARIVGLPKSFDNLSHTVEILFKEKYVRRDISVILPLSL